MNHALIELYNRCSENNLSPHATKCEAMLLTKTQFIGPLNSVIIGKERIEWINHTRRVGVTIDHRLSWSRHLNDVKKSFLNKLNLLKRSSFLSKNALLDLYFKVILPSVLYGLIVWGGCINAEQLNSLEILHRRAARVIYKLPKDLPSSDVYQHTNWDTIDYMYKLRLIKLFYKIVSEESPPTLSYLVNRPFTNYNLRNCNRITVPRFNSYFLKNSVGHRGAILWNNVCTHYTGNNFKTFFRIVNKDTYVKNINFNAQSVQSLPRFYNDFKCF